VSKQKNDNYYFVLNFMLLLFVMFKKYHFIIFYYVNLITQLITLYLQHKINIVLIE